MTAYYNEVDPYAAQWLRNLVAAGHIAPGDVDERSIVDIRADDLRGYAQCHFFAGIGGWSYALRLAGWDDARLVWTGSCPCQPFSAAGQGKAGDDERHLWPAWSSLIAECRPGTIFGEQVEAAVGWGWLDVVFADLEAEGYACGAAVLPACGVGAPHIRQRLWFVADADSKRRGEARHPIARERPRIGCPSGNVADADAAGRLEQRGGGLLDGERSPFGNDANGRGGLGHASSARLQEQRRERRISCREGTAEPWQATERAGDTGGMADAGCVSERRPAGCAEAPGGRTFGDAAGRGIRGDSTVEHAEGERSERRASNGWTPQRGGEHTGVVGNAESADGRGQYSEGSGFQYRQAGVPSPWLDLEWLPCTDGKARPVEPGTFPLASGIPARVGRLRAYGNSIVPQVAAEFIKACG